MNRNVLMLVALSWPLVAPLLSAGQQRGVDNRMIRYALQDQREWRAKQLPTNSVLYKQQYSKIFSGQLLRPEKQIENFMNPVINKNTENAYRASTASFPVFFDQGSNQLHPTIQDNFLGTNFKRRSGNSYSKWNKQFLSIQ